MLFKRNPNGKNTQDTRHSRRSANENMGKLMININEPLEQCSKIYLVEPDIDREREIVLIVI